MLATSPTQTDAAETVRRDHALARITFPAPCEISTTRHRRESSSKTNDEHRCDRSTRAISDGRTDGTPRLLARRKPRALSKSGETDHRRPRMCASRRCRRSDKLTSARRAAFRRARPAFSETTILDDATVPRSEVAAMIGSGQTRGAEKNQNKRSAPFRHWAIVRHCTRRSHDERTTREGNRARPCRPSAEIRSEKPRPSGGFHHTAGRNMAYGLAT